MCLNYYYRSRVTRLLIFFQQGCPQTFSRSLEGVLGRTLTLMLLSKHCFHWNKAACKRIVHCVCKQLTNCFVPNFHSDWTTKELITKRGRRKQGGMIQSVIQKIHFESVKTKSRFKLSQCCSQKSSGREICLISIRFWENCLRLYIYCSSGCGDS